MMMRWMCGHIRRDKIRNDVIQNKVGVASMANKIREMRFRWIGYVKRECEHTLAISTVPRHHPRHATPPFRGTEKVATFLRGGHVRQPGGRASIPPVASSRSAHLTASIPRLMKSTAARVYSDAASQILAAIRGIWRGPARSAETASICAKFWGITLVRYLGRFHGFVFGIPIVGPTIPVEAFGDRSEGKSSRTVSWSTRDRLSGRLWFSPREIEHYGGVWVSSMLNFYNSCLRPYFGKVLDCESMTLDIIEHPYLVASFTYDLVSIMPSLFIYLRMRLKSWCRLTHFWILTRRFWVYEDWTEMIIYGKRFGDISRCTLRRFGWDQRSTRILASFALFIWLLPKYRVDWFRSRNCVIAPLLVTSEACRRNKR
ncbi:hypothetical protein H5410_014172 [Solanum commersonii]|uniref:Uncharacterized protein n=1 Tax=Solanum commersonii TaxID=4109 RepID=A0A9J5ZQL1_SOLCO|nr:hypothetical protein H5410_014172 [Solanum commersonii]